MDDPIPMPYSHLLSQILNCLLVHFRELGPPPTPLPLGYDINSRYEFHSGAPGHTVEDCRALKHKVQDLVDSKAITFTPNSLNILKNPIPPQEGTPATP